VLVALSTASPAAATAEVVSGEGLQRTLDRHLRDGRVDYGALARDRAELDAFIARAAEADPTTHPVPAQLAFWVNVYNARTLARVLDHPGLASVLDVGRFAGVPTLRFWRERRRSGRRQVSLDDIEHRILRREFREPRIHFVVNCASIGCPDLPARVLTADSLEAQLAAATRGFLADRSRNRVAPDGTLELSRILDWYGRDFGDDADRLVFVRRHWTGPWPGPSPRMRFLDYDWGLNGTWTP
jgi:hypothetical protein